MRLTNCAIPGRENRFCAGVSLEFVHRVEGLKMRFQVGEIRLVFGSELAVLKSGSGIPR